MNGVTNVFVLLKSTSKNSLSVTMEILMMFFILKLVSFQHFGNIFSLASNFSFMLSFFFGANYSFFCSFSIFLSLTCYHFKSSSSIFASIASCFFFSWAKKSCEVISFSIAISCDIFNFGSLVL